MADHQGIRWRTFLEVGIISAVIYFLLGAPGLPAGIISEVSTQGEVPVAKAKVESLVYPQSNLRCSKHKFDVHVFSTAPLIIYIDGFLSEEEAEHLVRISQNKWQVSTVFNEGVETTDEAVRKSEKALIERDETVQCIEQRALDIQGWPQETFIERLWTQRYNETGHYAHHYDWATASRTSRRVSTFMVYVSAECAGGGTNFPRIQTPQSEHWCEFIECGDSSEPGVTFKPRKGAAVFWTNFDQDGRGYKETIHAGMPVTSGTKIGLNIWSWYQAGHRIDA
ncbi:hypothetical protein KC332_g4838 [Hortaea werneckii]|uniref:Fe2OG dioxygenase domain-containing protein n=1 Tax=Hortaea werneckii EXF-2000 TaxID=1157616 RepID=A0A1Z5TJE9_HORWE|nr:hypothetical protein KC358_g4550 [Hortaea werneckii]OTA36105.1 hypothetical protein BTJ68_03414 [Hortaea werneckii EXF-2000]KAI6847541.1 hypothetical protein KC350_g3411 [Hortaea werneckii]KAI6937009.1 hypothetical protein KC341_g5861 [Hortaea werneckii]KAI6941098.1 hypothetical protein KC348_g4782 [Hortaea werneckii]